MHYIIENNIVRTKIVVAALIIGVNKSYSGSTVRGEAM